MRNSPFLLHSDKKNVGREEKKKKQKKKTLPTHQLLVHYIGVIHQTAVLLYVAVILILNT